MARNINFGPDTTGDHLVGWATATGSAWIDNEVRAAVLAAGDDPQSAFDDVDAIRDAYIDSYGPRDRWGDLDEYWVDDLMTADTAIELCGRECMA